MGFRFAGFFTEANPAILDAAVSTWQGCCARQFTEPFHGLGVAVPEHALMYGDSDEEQERAQDLAYRLEDELDEWSTQFPDAVFAFLNADCFGGKCRYVSYICQNGKTYELIQGSDKSAKDALIRLLEPLGVTLNDAS